MLENEINRGNFNADISVLQDQAVFFGHAVETPGEIRFLAIQAANLAHPLATPRTRIEEWYEPERPADRSTQTGAKSLASDHLRMVRIDCVQQEINASQQQFLDSV